MSDPRPAASTEERSLPPSYRFPLPRWLTVTVPLFVLIYPYILYLIPAINWEAGLNREYGFVENFTALCLLAATITYLMTLPRSLGKIHLVWLVLLALGAFVFLGEEISWGQHFMKWSTPEDWKELNRQGETNIHNLNGTVEFIFTKVLRNVLSSGCLIGGLFIPWYCIRKKFSFRTDDLKFWLWPSIHTALVGILVHVSSLPAKLAHEFKIDTTSHFKVMAGEAKEAFIALFIFLYALTQYRLAGQLKKRQ